MIAVLGGGVCGLAAGLMLARDGHDVTVLERDEACVPGDPEAAWAWRRPGVAQFNQAHYLQPLGRAVLEAELPDVLDGFVADGAVRTHALELLPPGIADRAPRPGDERFVGFTGRRSTLELALARAACAQPRLTVRRGVSAAGFTFSGGRVSGVVTNAGDTLAAGLVVDAMGRGSRLPRLLGAPVAEESADSGFLYYTRFFRGDAPPETRGPRLMPVGSISLLTLPGDNGTWSVTLYASAGDRPLKRLRHPGAWSAVVRACPLQAHWLDGTPVTGVLPMGGVTDRYRDAAPAPGVAALGDACASTNPSLGRGMALGLLHAAALRETVRAGFSAEAWRAATERTLLPWYRATVATDRARLAQIEAIRAGRPPAPPVPLLAAMGYDADVFRAAMDVIGCLALPEEVMTRPGIAERVHALANGGSPLPGPDRESLLRLVA